MIQNLTDDQILEIKTKNLEKHFLENCPKVQNADLLFTGEKDKFKYFQFLINIVLSVKSVKDELIIFKDIFFILPHGSVVFDIKKGESLLNEILKSRGILAAVSLIEIASLDLMSVVAIIESNVKDTNNPKAFIICSLEKIYHNEKLIDIFTEEYIEDNFITSEDREYENIANCTVFLTNYVSDKNIYLILDTDFNTHHNNEYYINRFSGFENLGITGFGASEEQKKEIDDINNIIGSAIKYIKNHEIGLAFSLIDQADKIVDKDFIKLQLLYQANKNDDFSYLVPHIHKLFEKLNFEIKSISSKLAVNLAKIALETMSVKYVGLFLDKILQESESIVELESALSIAQEISEYYFVEEISNKLKLLFPNSNKVPILEVMRLIDEEKFIDASELILEKSLNVKLAEILIRFESYLKEKDFNYIVFLNNEKLNFYESFELVPKLLIRHAFKRDALYEVYDVLKESEKLLGSDRVTDNKINILERLFFLNNDISENDLIFVFKIIDDICFNIYFSPENQSVRERFLDVLDWSNVDSKGVEILASTTCRKMINTEFNISLLVDENNEYGVDDIQNYRSIFINCLNFFKRKKIVLTGKDSLPSSVFPSSKKEVDKFIKFIGDTSNYTINNGFNVDQINLINMKISIIISASKYSSNPNIDICFIKNTASLLIQYGYNQLARDYAEQILQISLNSCHKRLAIAWLSIAEIYQRLGRNISSIFYIRCALENNNLTSEEFFNLSTILIRSYRDLGLLIQSKDIYNFSLRLISELDSGFFFKNKFIYDFLIISIEFKELSLCSTGSVERISELMASITCYAKDQLENNRELNSIAVILFQVIDLAKNNEVDIPVETLLIIELIGKSGQGDVLNSFSEVHLSNNFNSIFNFYKNLNNNRNATDMAYDSKLIHKLVADYLSVSQSDNVVNRFFSLELLADQSLPAENIMFYDKPISFYSNLSDPVCIAKEICINNDISIVLIGLDGRKKFVVGLCNMHGDVEIFTENDLDLSFEKFLKWKVDFPYKYDNDNPEHDFNYIYDSMSDIGLNINLDGEVFFVLDTSIHSLTPKLFQHNDNFLGYSNLAIAITPSISWLKNKMDNDQITNGRLECWISDDKPSTVENEILPLQIMLDNFQSLSIFDDFDIHLNQENSLPKTFKNSELVIIGAHGSVSEKLHTFSKISDEAQLKEHYSKLARRLENCGVVILFVCSSGRFNSHPEANTTIGLAKELIKNGCSAVIASPWPLDVMCTSHWLSKFLSSWINERKTLNKSVCEANLHVAERYSYDPLKYLALTIYGNPLRVYNN